MRLQTIQCRQGQRNCEATDKDGPIYRVRQGRYRIAIRCVLREIVILNIAHRKDIYRHDPTIG